MTLFQPRRFFPGTKMPVTWGISVQLCNLWLTIYGSYLISGHRYKFECIVLNELAEVDKFRMRLLIMDQCEFGRWPEKKNVCYKAEMSRSGIILFVTSLRETFFLFFFSKALSRENTAFFLNFPVGLKILIICFKFEFQLLL